jgi:hypothetical protein
MLSNIGFLFRVHGQEFNSFRRATRWKTLREFQLRPRETFIHTCGAIDLWEWSFGFSMRNREPKATTGHCVWAVVAPRLRSTAAAPPAIG